MLMVVLRAPPAGRGGAQSEGGGGNCGRARRRAGGQAGGWMWHPGASCSCTTALPIQAKGASWPPKRDVGRAQAAPQASQRAAPRWRPPGRPAGAQPSKGSPAAAQPSRRAAKQARSPPCSTSLIVSPSASRASRSSSSSPSASGSASGAALHEHPAGSTQGSRRQGGRACDVHEQSHGSAGQAGGGGGAAAVPWGAAGHVCSALVARAAVLEPHCSTGRGSQEVEVYRLCHPQQVLVVRRLVALDCQGQRSRGGR